MKVGTWVKMSAAYLEAARGACGKAGKHLGPFDPGGACLEDPGGDCWGCSSEHVREFGHCEGIVLGPMFPGTEAPEVDVRWMPSGLKYGYKPEDLVPFVKMWRYTLPSINGEGWAVFILASDGYFSVISDFGNYCHGWSHHGHDDFRKFLLRADRDWDYFLNKVSPDRVYDGVETVKAIRRALCEARRSMAMRGAEGTWTKEVTREEWDSLDELDVEGSDEGFRQWIEQTQLDEPWEFRHKRHKADATAFAKKILPRLVPVLKAQLESEQGPSNPAPDAG